MGEMATLNVQVKVPASLLACGLDQGVITESVNEALALKLFQSGLITFGTAASLLGMDRRGLLGLLRERGVSYFNLDREELERELHVLDKQPVARVA